MAEIPRAYQPQSVESKWYSYWLDRRLFRADPQSSKPAYSIVIPPPNVTGVLHMGHVLNNTIQDILIRKAWMEGYEALWLPGTDHAGIATQMVVEKSLKKHEGISRRDLGREAFVKKVWKWKEKHGGIIIEQLKKLGCACDWSRERFTMDAAYCKAVADTFADLYRKGLIYRGKRMVNWCPGTQTALSDEEVIMTEQRGLLYYFRVEILEEPGTFLTIATTRPETIPGDAGIAVHPKDDRYSRYVGQHALRPLPSELPREKKAIPIVADEHVDFEFGTGVLKVTPAHDKADFEIGRRQRLDFIEVMDAGGTMNALAGRDLAGMDRIPARAAAAQALREQGLLVKEEPYTNHVGYSERAGVPIEPRLSEQWFMRYPSSEAARKLVAKGEIQFYPDRWAKVFDHWMANLQDWCISRQLWWGHPIPVWYRGDQVRCQVETPGPDWKQDPDVLDTWCSSWLWPFATMDAETRAKFYPTTVLVTAPEILFFWVARMIMSGLEYTGTKPFNVVCLHGVVRDKQNRKMSKSLGNSPNPLSLIEKYGADALRFGVMRSTPRGQDTLFDEQNVALGRNFCNKLWNACRYRQIQGEVRNAQLDAGYLSSDDKWILLRLDIAIREMSVSLGAYKFNEATQVLYRFFWSEFCDWYLETTKVVFQSGDATERTRVLAVLDCVLAQTLRLFHPFLPFITEELWNGMEFGSSFPPGQGRETIMLAPWPRPFSQDFLDSHGLGRDDLERAQARYALVKQGRNLRREFHLPAHQRIPYVLKPSREIEDHDVRVLKTLLNAEPLEIAPDFQAQKGTPSVVSPTGELFLPLAGLIDLDTEKMRLSKEIDKLQREVDKARKKLDSPAFTQKAPEAVIAEHQRRLQDWTARLEHTRANLAAITHD